MTSKEDHYKALIALYLALPQKFWVRPRIDIQHRFSSLSVRLLPDALLPTAVACDSAIFQMLRDACFLAASAQETTLLTRCNKFQFRPFKAVPESRIYAIGKVTNACLHQWQVESTLYDSDDNELAWGSGVFSRTNVPLESLAPYKNQSLKNRQRWNDDSD